MGFYIPNGQPLEYLGAVPTSRPKSLADVPQDKALICQVDNFTFQANGLIYSQRELEEFSDLSDRRPKRWFLMDKEKAHELADYNEKAA